MDLGWLAGWVGKLALIWGYNESIENLLVFQRAQNHIERFKNQMFVQRAKNRRQMAGCFKGTNIVWFLNGRTIVWF